MKIFKNVRAYRFTQELPTPDEIVATVDKQAFSDASKGSAQRVPDFKGGSYAYKTAQAL